MSKNCYFGQMNGKNNQNLNIRVRYDFLTQTFVQI